MVLWSGRLWGRVSLETTGGSLEGDESRGCCSDACVLVETLHPHETTVNNNTRSSHVITRGTRQHDNSAAQVHGLTPTLRRHPSHYIVVEVLVFRIRHILIRHGCTEVARVNAVALNTVLGPLVRHRFGDLQDAAFRCSVAGLGRLVSDGL